MDDFPAIPDTESDITNHIRSVVEDAISGNMRSEDYQGELWTSIAPMQGDIQVDLKRFGTFQSITLVESKSEGKKRINRYRIDFEKLRSLMRFELDDHKKVVSFQSEATERKPGADLEE